MNQLDRIEARLEIITELLALEPMYIRAIVMKHPDREWEKVNKLRAETMEKLKQIYDSSNPSI